MMKYRIDEGSMQRSSASRHGWMRFVACGFVVMGGLSVLRGMAQAMPPALQDGEAPAESREQDGERSDKPDPVALAKRALIESLVDGVLTPERRERFRGFTPKAFFAELRRLVAEQRDLAKVFESRVVSDADESDSDAVEERKTVSAEAKAAARADLMAYLLGDAEKRAIFLAHGEAARDVQAAFGDKLQEVRLEQLRGAIDAFSANGARYIGQYRRLSEFGDDLPELLLKLVEETSQIALRRRPQVLMALRDFIRDIKSDKRLEPWVELAENEFEDPQFRLTLIGVLAYGGRTRLYDAKVEQLNKIAEDESKLLAAWTQLVELQSVAERNDEACATYRKVIEHLEPLGDSQQLGVTYYNLACSLEKTKKRDEAFEALESSLRLAGKALAQGTLWQDMDIAGMREDERFLPLCKKFDLEPPRPAKGDARK